MAFVFPESATELHLIQSILVYEVAKLKKKNH